MSSKSQDRIASKLNSWRRARCFRVDGRTWLEPLEGRLLLTGEVVVVSGLHAVAANIRGSAPVLTEPPDGTVNVGSTYTYKLTATGSPAPTFSLVSGPPGMVVNSATGVITFTPNAGLLGERGVIVKATNNLGSSTKDFSLIVTNWVAPVISTPTNLVATAGGNFTYQLAATGNPAPTFSLVSGPDGMTVDSGGLISWSPPASLTGTQSVTVSAANLQGTTTSTFGVTVGPDTTKPTAPVLTIGPVTAVDSLPLSWSGSTDDVGVVGYRIFAYTPAVYRGHSGRGGGYTLVSPAKFTLLVDGIPSTDYTITGLAPLSTHQYAVAAYDAAGNQSPYSAVVAGTTLQQPTFYWENAGVTQNPPLTVVANHTLTFYLFTTGSPSPTLSLISAPDGAVYTPAMNTNSQLTTVIAHVTWTPTEDQVGAQVIMMEAANSVGVFDASIPVTVTPDTPQLSIALNGGITYGSAQYAAGQSDYQVVANPYYGSAANPQYGLSGTPFNFQVSSVSNSEPTTYALVSGPDGMTLDPDTGAGTWTPTKDQAGPTSVAIAATNAAGTSTLELSFPTYFTGAPGAPVATYLTTVSGSPINNPVISWDAPADTVGILGYRIDVTDAHTGAVTTFDTLSAATSFALTGLGTQQYFVTVTPYDAAGNVGQTSAAISIYAAALPALSWTVSSSSATVGTPLSVQFSPNYSGMAWSLVSGPNGAVIDPNTGLLTWTPDQPGDATFLVSTSANGWGTIQALLTISAS